MSKRSRKRDRQEMEKAVRQQQEDMQRNRFYWISGGQAPPPMLKEPKKPEPVPVFSECVIGYRWWKIDAFGRLRPQSVDQRPWVPGVNTAVCDYHQSGLAAWLSSYLYPESRPQRTDHKAPHGECECGLYARFSLDEVPALDLYESMSDDDRARIVAPAVMGAVASWGDLQVHYDGMRAEKACVTALAFVPGMPQEVMDLVRRVAESYGVPAVPLDLLALEAGQHGTPLPEEAKPKRPPMSSYDLYTRFAAPFYTASSARVIYGGQP